MQADLGPRDPLGHVQADQGFMVQLVDVQDDQGPRDQVSRCAV